MEDNYPIPSNADFERMPSSPMLQVRSEITGRIYTFNIGDNVVVISTSDEEWHARLLDIRHDKVEDVVWLRVQWFHNATDLRNQRFGRYIGSQELVLSHDVDLVEAGCLEHYTPGKERILMFDEGAAFGPAIGPTQRYMRWSMKVKDVRTIWSGHARRRKAIYEIEASHTHIFLVIQGSVTKCPGCDKGYNPDRDLQRFCRSCETWYHVECLERLPASMSGIPAQVEVQTSLPHGRLGADLQSILHIPIQRGCGYGVVGNGKAILHVWGVFEEMRGQDTSPPPCWQDAVDPDMLRQSQDAHEYYYCMVCSKDGIDSFM
ncbi:hypothetical protein BU15DRAFT_68750 [Melanogaster broomeanus]|nr:hypothetical protein BU15DRAFT_68750 [Melanogaster broomeanus]